MNETERRHRRRYTLIPAGILIGLGIGLLAGHPAAGALIGLGLGFIGSSFEQDTLPPPGEGGPGGAAKPARFHWFMAAIGVLFIMIGIGTVYTPVNIWPYLGAIFLILLGIWFITREYSWGS